MDLTAAPVVLEPDEAAEPDAPNPEASPEEDHG